MHGYYHCKVWKEKDGVIQILGRDYDRDIFDLQNQVTNAFIIIL